MVAPIHMSARAQLAGLAAAALFAAAAVLGTDVDALRAPAAFALVGFLPGWLALAAAGVHARLELSQRLALTAALSFTLNVLVGLGMYVGSGGFRVDTWAISLAAVALVFAWLAFRRLDDPARLSLTDVVVYAGAAVLLAGALAVSVGSPPARDARPMFPDLSVVATGQADVRLAVRSHAARTERYTLEVGIRGRQPALRQAIVLAPGASWGATVPAPAALGYRQVVVRLTLPGQPEYRALSL